MLCQNGKHLQEIEIEIEIAGDGNKLCHGGRPRDHNNKNNRSRDQMYIHSTNISAETMREFRGETFFVLPSSNREFSFLLLYLTCLQGLELPAGGAPGAPHFVGHYEYPSLPWIFQGFLRFNTKKIVVKVALNLPALLALMFLSIVLYKKRTSFFA